MYYVEIKYWVTCVFLFSTKHEEHVLKAWKQIRTTDVIDTSKKKIDKFLKNKICGNVNNDNTINTLHTRGETDTDNLKVECKLGFGRGTQ